MLNGKERNGTGRRKWNEMEQNGTDQNTHMERFTAREGGREGKFFSIITCTNGTERNGKPKKNGTERQGGRD
jgi:hypothetical protein